MFHLTIENHQNQMKKIAVFASGSGTNAQKLFEHFENHSQIKVDVLLSNKKDAYVLERAKKFGIETRVFNRDEFVNSQEIELFLKQREIDLIVLAGFLWKIPESLVQAFSNRIINIHPALLPKYGGKGMYGMRVHEAVVEAGESETGITIHYVNERYDEGKVILQAKCRVLEGDSPEQVAQKVHELEYEFLAKTTEQLLIH